MFHNIGECEHALTVENY